VGLLAGPGCSDRVRIDSPGPVTRSRGLGVTGGGVTQDNDQQTQPVPPVIPVTTARVSSQPRRRVPPFRPGRGWAGASADSESGRAAVTVSHWRCSGASDRDRDRQSRSTMAGRDPWAQPPDYSAMVNSQPTQTAVPI
jgi:hypothetical protein